jgi:hypothetical protein
MSYDYSLFKAPAPGPMESWPADSLAPLGSLDEVKAILSQWFPVLEWRQFKDTWFGKCADTDRYAEIQLTPDSDGLLRFMTLRRVQREEVERLCDRLGIVAVDPQRMELYSNLTRRWSQAR